MDAMRAFDLRTPVDQQPDFTVAMMWRCCSGCCYATPIQDDFTAPCPVCGKPGYGNQCRGYGRAFYDELWAGATTPPTLWREENGMQASFHDHRTTITWFDRTYWEESCKHLPALFPWEAMN